jgi:hypothetical protein
MEHKSNVRRHPFTTRDDPFILQLYAACAEREHTMMSAYRKKARSALPKAREAAALFQAEAELHRRAFPDVSRDCNSGFLPKTCSWARRSARVEGGHRARKSALRE